MRIIKDNDELKSLIDENNNIVINESIICDFNIDVNANIIAGNIIARDIDAWNINALDIIAWNIIAGNIIARDIDAWNINALDINVGDIIAWKISYYAVCVAYNNINCNSIIGNRNNCKHFVLDGKINIKGVDE